MEARGQFTFKSITPADGGSFTNEKGQVINYNPSYLLKLDELVEDKIFERRFKIQLENKTLIDSLLTLKPYDKINMKFDVLMYLNSTKLIPNYFELTK